MIEVIPAIIPKNLKDLEDKVEKVFRHVRRIQVDVLDGEYAGQPSWPFKNEFQDFLSFEQEENGLPHWEEVDYEFDLMIGHPENTFERFIRAGATTLIFHSESTEKLDDILESARNYEIGIGLALKPKTAIESIAGYLSRIDFVQFMGNDHIGEQGVSLDPAVIAKIEDFHNKHPETSIGIDIGVNFDTAPILRKAGVTRLVSGSAVFNSSDVEETIRILSEYK